MTVATMPAMQRVHDRPDDGRVASASPNQWSVNPVGGQAWRRLGLKA